MSLIVFIAVIFAAILHSVWNGMVKNQDDKYIALADISGQFNGFALVMAMLLLASASLMFRFKQTMLISISK